MRQLHATRITPSGRAWLAKFEGARALHIFEHVCNLIDPSGVVLSLQSEPVPASPVSLALPVQPLFESAPGGFPDWLDRESRIDIQDEELHLGDLVIHWQQAEIWDPRPAWTELRLQSQRWRPLVAEIVPILLTEAPANSLAPLLGAGISAPAQAKDELIAERILTTARPAAERFQRGLAQSDVTALEKGARALAGLGAGLTPSGDDYLMGVMHALWATKAADRAGKWSQLISATASPRTGPLSATWLQAAAQGEATGSWHRLLGDLLVGDVDRLLRSVRQIMKIGHSSGADGLAGFCQTLQS